MGIFEEEILDDEFHLEFGVPKSYFAMIAPHFENLTVLDLSRKNIQSLPPSISMLSLLLQLILQECSMLTELPPEIGMLKNLMTCDLGGTEIMYLPEEMGKLENLKCLRVSFCSYADEYKDRNVNQNIIPRTIMSVFSKLEELSIYVNPDAKWWQVEVTEAILEKLHFLSSLKTIKLYLPTAKELQYFLQIKNRQGPIYLTLQEFSLKVGHSEQLTSYLKTKLMDSFEKLEKCLKYENGEGSTNDIKELVRHAKALFVWRHWTIEKLSIFDISRLKYCLLAECNELQTVFDADEIHGKNAFESLEYLAIHSMKILQSIWKGKIVGKSFSCLQVIALHTCPELTTIFTEGMLHKLCNLTVVIVEDCPKVSSLVSQESSQGNNGSVLPNLKKILLLDLPELVSLSSGVFIAPHLDTLLVFNCSKLDYLSYDELSRHVKEIKGETEWWHALKNIRDLAYSRAFVPLKWDGYMMNQLAEDTNSLKEFYKLRGRGESSAISASTSVSPDSQPSPAQLNSNETNKHIDWDMFIQYLKYRKPSVPLVQFNTGHVIEFLKYLNKFGDIRVHMQSCVLFGHPDPAATCFCPLSEAWDNLEAIVTRLHHAYKEKRLPDPDPFDSRHIQSYLKEIRKSQENALDEEILEEICEVLSSDEGESENASPFKIMTAEEKLERIRENSTSKKVISGSKDLPIPILKGNSTLVSPQEDSGAGTMDNVKQGFRSSDAVTESSKLTEVLKAFDAILTLKSVDEMKVLISFIDTSLTDTHQYLVATDLVQRWFNCATKYRVGVGYLEPFSIHKKVIWFGKRRLMDEFRAILQVKIKSREDSSSVNPSSTIFPGTLSLGSSSTYEVQEDMSPMVISDLRSILKRASSAGCIQRFVEIYIHERKTIMQSRFPQFNINKWSTYEVEKLEWGVLESLIEVWIKSVKTSLEYLFASEKGLCEKIFQGLGTDIQGICYEVIIQDYQIHVFNIIYTLRFSNPPPDKIFMILDLYETLDYFLNKMCFLANPTVPFQTTVHTQLFTVLSDKIVSRLSTFEMVLLYHESSVILVCPVDPLAMYVMSYLYQLCDHKHALRKLSLPNLPSIDEDDLSLYSEELKGKSELSRHVIWILMTTVSNLEGKAKLCTDASAGQFFSMKNIHYIAHKIEGHQALMEVVGDDYYGRLILKFDQAKVKYVLLSLRSEME